MLYKKNQTTLSTAKMLRLTWHSIPQRSLICGLLHWSVFFAISGCASDAWAQTMGLSVRCRGAIFLSARVVGIVAHFASIAAAAQCVAFYGGAWVYFTLCPSVQPTDTIDAGDHLCDRTSKMTVAKSLSLYILLTLLFALEAMVLWVVFGSPFFASGFASNGHPLIYGVLIVVSVALHLRCFGQYPDEWGGDGAPSENSSTLKLFERVDQDIHDLTLEADLLLRVFEELDAESREAHTGWGSSALETDSLLRGGSGKSESRDQGKPHYETSVQENDDGTDQMDAVTLGQASAAVSSLTGGGTGGEGSSSYFAAVPVQMGVMPHVRTLEPPFSALVISSMVSIICWCWVVVQQLGSSAFTTEDGTHMER
mmetsp:Transcript_19310/g.39153  ORF Transcript_19310/g.39153 Transcript_19310/m.39153 type:complete len:368 (-) Transcript_19310:39-1142(-)